MAFATSELDRVWDLGLKTSRVEGLTRLYKGCIVEECRKTEVFGFGVSRGELEKRTYPAATSCR